MNRTGTITQRIKLTRDEQRQKVRELLQDLVDTDSNYLSYDEGCVLADQYTDKIMQIFS